MPRADSGWCASDTHTNASSLTLRVLRLSCHCVCCVHSWCALAVRVHYTATARFVPGTERNVSESQAYAICIASAFAMRKNVANMYAAARRCTRCLPLSLLPVVLCIRVRVFTSVCHQTLYVCVAYLYIRTCPCRAVYHQCCTYVCVAIRNATARRRRCSKKRSTYAYTRWATTIRLYDTRAVHTLLVVSFTLHGYTHSHFITYRSSLPLPLPYRCLPDRMLLPYVVC
jgi:hypothetical protein